MSDEIDVWRLVAGLGLFLFGMATMEHALRDLAGRTFKRFITQQTATPLKSVVVGVLSTAALQSSSVVSLIVLAFLGAGIVSLASAIGIVFGANVGTTATGWIVATLGFKVDIEALALPLIACGAFAVVWTRSATRVAGLGNLMVGLGLMLIGLDFMKSGAIAATQSFDPATLAERSLLVFLAAGLLLTAVIQSSSATIMITLSALYVSAISLHAAAAVAIGADLGTTITAVLGTLAGSVDKKRLVVAIVLFNVLANAIAFIFLDQLLYFITGPLGVTDPLFALVAFHSLFNGIGVLLALPLIRPLTHWLSEHFLEQQPPLLRHINKSSMAVPEAAVENIRRETYRLLDQVAALNQSVFVLPPDASFYDSKEDRLATAVFGSHPDFDQCYGNIKQLEGDILTFALRLQREPLGSEESARLGQLIPAIRNAVHSAKSVKDIREDLRSFEDSVNDRFHSYTNQFRESEREFYELLGRLMHAELDTLRFERLVDLKSKAEQIHGRLHQRIYDEVRRAELSRIEISTLLNVNRELHVSHLSLVSSLADALLGIEAANEFESIKVAS